MDSQRQVGATLGATAEAELQVAPKRSWNVPLTEVAIKNAKPAGKALRMFDGGGLYLEISIAGGKWWRLKYRIGGKEKRISLGTYPQVSLKEARARRDGARAQLATGVDPGAVRKAEKLSGQINSDNSFEAIAREWYAKYLPTWSESHAIRNLARLEADVFPWLGKTPIAKLTPSEILGALARVERRGALETAHRLRGIIGQVMRYAVATGRAIRDVTIDLRGALPPAPTRHYSAITDIREIGQLLRAIDGYKGTFVVACALRLASLLFQRPGELRAAEWAEFNLVDALWEIPAARMKRSQQGKANGGAHIVPLSVQAVRILSELQPLTGDGPLVFPSIRTNTRPMSDNTVNAALRRLGYDQSTMTGHGFRAMARTVMVEELGIPVEIIEAQLAHAVRDPLGRAYNRTTFLKERRDMMQRWADYLDELKGNAGAKPMPRP
ncbi:Prophage integrase IntS [Burkholderia gladioli]